MNKSLRKNIWKIYIYGFLVKLHFFGAILVPYFVDWIKISYTQTFILQAFFMILVFLFEVPTGIISDRYGRKISLVFASIFGLFMCLTFGFSTNYYTLFIGEFFAAISISLISGSDKALLHDTILEAGLKRKSREYMSRHESIGLAGIIVSLPIGSLVVGNATYPSSMIITWFMTAGASILALIIGLMIKEPKKHVRTKINPLKEGINGFRYIFKHEKLRAFALHYTLISASTFFIFWIYQPLLLETGIKIDYAGFVAAGFNILAIVLMLNVNILEKIIGTKNTLFFSAILPGIFFVILGIFRHWILVVIGISIVAALKLFRRPVLIDFMNEHIESRNRATVLSGVSMLDRIITVPLQIIVGLMMDVSIYYTLLFLGIITIFFSIVTRVDEDKL